MCYNDSNIIQILIQTQELYLPGVFRHVTMSFENNFNFKYKDIMHGGKSTMSPLV